MKFLVTNIKRCHQLLIIGLLFLNLLGCGISKKRYTRLPLDLKKYTELPLDLTSGLNSIPVVVNGDSLKFIFDTGAAASVLYYKDSSLEKPIGTTTISTILGEQHTFPLIRIDNLSLGENKFPHHQVISIKKPEGADYDGIIGNDIAKYFSVKIDFLNKKLIFHDRPDSSDMNSLRVPIWMEDRMIYTVLNFGEVSDTFLIDTGFSGSMKMKNDLYERVVSRDSSADWLEAKERTVADRLAKFKSKSKYGLVDVKVGSRTFKDQLAEADNGNLNLLGASFFKQQSFVEFNYLDTTMFIRTFPAVTFHAQQGTVGSDKFVPVEETVNVLHMEWLAYLDRYINSIGINFRLTDDKHAIVSGLRQDSSIISRALQLGDTLVGYDSVLFEYQDLYNREEVSAKGYQIVPITAPITAMDSIIVHRCFTEKNNWMLHFKKNGKFLSVPATRRIVYKSNVIQAFGHLPPKNYPFIYKFHFKPSPIGHFYLVRPNLLGSDVK